MSRIIGHTQADLLHSLQAGPMSPLELMEDTGRSSGVVSAGLRSLVRRGCALRVNARDYGRSRYDYYITDKGHADLAEYEASMLHAFAKRSRG